MATDVFMKLDGIKGESADSSHKGELDVLSWGWGVSQTGASHVGGGPGAGKAHVNDLSFTKRVDRSSPVLFQMCCSGAAIKTGVLTCRKAGGTPLEYIHISMTQIIVTSVTLASEQTGDYISENITLNFATVNYEYVPQNADGSGAASVTKGWNIAGNVAV